MKKGLLLAVLSVFVGVATAFSVCVSPANIRKASSQQKSYSFTLNTSNINFLPASASTTEAQSTVDNSPKTTNGNPIIFSYANCANYGSSGIRFKTNGYLSNVTAFTGLKAITISTNKTDTKLSWGSSNSSYSNPITITSGVRYELSSMSYFKITAGSITYITSITVEYLCDGSGELDPVSEHTHHGYHYLAKEATMSEPGNKEFYACSECQYVSLSPGDGVYTNAVLTYELPDNHIAYIPPLGLAVPSQFDYPIPVSIYMSSAGYEVDRTGNTDASSAIQSALNSLYNIGGGTVYVPAGKYLLANQLTIPTRVALVGDFKGVDADDYGTVFLCTKASDGTNNLLNNAQVVLNSSASINGITFYYPNQNITNVVEYGPTVYCNHNLTANISNIFFINSYRGIDVNDVNDKNSAGELVNIENIYGTCLSSGIKGYYQSDVGYWSNIHISPSYYETALSEYRCNNVSALYRYTRDHLTAFTLADLDDFTLNKIYVDNANVGILFPSEVIRDLQAFWGILNDVHLTDCLTGVFAELIFKAGAALFTHSELGKVINNSPVGMIKLAKCRYDELLGSGMNLVELGSETYEAAPAYDDSHNYNIPAKIQYITGLDRNGVTDVSTALQTELNKCQNGGVVVIENGTYRLDSPITVPSNTMLTSYNCSYTRGNGYENYFDLVKFISYSNDSCVKLSSDAGINGIHIFNVYKDPDTAYNVLSTSQTDSYVGVKGIGNNCFAINTEVSYTFTAFDFTNVSNHYIKHCYGSAYDTFVKASGSGKIINSLSNLSYLARCPLHQFAQANQTALEKYYDFEDSSKDAEHEKARDITRTYSTMIKLTGGNELALNCFSYGIKTLIDTSNTTLLAIITSQDNLKDTSYAYIINGGDVKIVDTFRVFGKSFNLLSGHLEIYGRYDFTNKLEVYYNSNTSSSDDPESLGDFLDEDVLSYCEYTSGFDGGTRNSTYKYQGSYSYRASSQSNPAISYSFAAKNISEYMASGYLRFYVYCTNISKKGDEAFVEITSGGTCDVDEITINVIKQITKSGWNEIIIKLSEFENGPGTFDSTAANYFRFYVNGSSCYYYIDYISFFHKPITGNPLIINRCDSDYRTIGVDLSDYRVEGTHSFVSQDSVNAVMACVFSPINASSYLSTGYLSFYFYVEDLSKFGDYGFVELTSSELCDVEEITCRIDSYITEEGWNHVQIPLSAFYASGSGTFNPANLNFFRLYTINSSCKFYLDDIRLVK